MRTILPDDVDTFLRAIVKLEQPVSVSEVARLLGVHTNTVKRIDPEHLPYFRVGSRGDRRYQRDDVRAYIYARLNDPMERRSTSPNGGRSEGLGQPNGVMGGVPSDQQGGSR
jgi:excisionase family DNA binding protein